MNQWRLLITAPDRGAWNMAVDEAILEAAGKRSSPPTLRLYAWNPPCLSLGYAQPFADVDRARLIDRGWDVVRRATGGRAILHTDELTYSIAAPLDDPLVQGSLLESYNRIAQALVSASRSLGLPVEIKDVVPGVHTPSSGPVCFEVPSAYEITVDGKKLIGSAQARRKEGVLQHGSLPLHGDLTRITQALVFEHDQAREIASQRLLARATTAETILKRIVSWDDAAGAFMQAFASELGLVLKQGELTDEESTRASELAREKYDHPSWNERV